MSNSKYEITVDIMGTKRWKVNGKLHRKGGPALIDFEGCEVWFRRGKVHRKDGPAKTYPDGSKEWWIADERLTEDEFKSYLLAKKLEVNLQGKGKSKSVKI